MTVAIDLSGKVAIVTGAGSGIGRASALLFAAAGAQVIAADRAETVHDTPQGNPLITAHQCDTADEAAVIALVARARSEFGGLDIVFANAGIAAVPPTYWESGPEDWAEVLRINLIGPALAVKHAAPLMVRAGGGAIVCTASVAGLRSGAGPASYSASKAGVINLVQTAAQQLSGTRVRVNAICPGLIETGMTKRAYDYARANDKLGRIGQVNPLRRGGQPEEIAAAALFLVSPLASYINGHALVVDGGLSSSHPLSPGELSRGYTGP